jgi:CSLREA domain-containing protein
MPFGIPAIKRALPGPLLLLLLGFPGVVQATTITVNTVNDELNSDGDCSLREAIRAANSDTAVDGCLAGQGHDVIHVPAGTYNITLAGAFEDLGVTGDLDLHTALDIRGAGSRTTRINAGGLDRVFDVQPASSATLSGLAIGGGNVDGSGGAIQNEGSLTVTRSTVRDSSAFGDGGGIYNSGTLRLTLSTVFGNQAFNSGGGISNNGALRAVNSTLSGNRVIDPFGADRGGGLRSTGGSVEMLNVTINVNEAGTGGGIVNDGGTVSVRNVIVANSPGHANCEGPITSAGHNLDSGATCGFTGPGDLSNTDPLLGPLANNGGPTNTHALLPDSPAVDAGTNNSCPDTDQRGVPRPQDGDGDGMPVCDMGSVEAME